MLAGPRYTFAERCGLDPKNRGALIVIQLKDLAENERQAMRAVEAKQHGVCTADLHFLQQQMLLDSEVGRRFAQSFSQVTSELVEAQLGTLSAPFPRAEQIVRGHSERPRGKRTFPPKAAEMGNDPHKDFL